MSTYPYVYSIHMRNTLAVFLNAQSVPRLCLIKSKSHKLFSSTPKFQETDWTNRPSYAKTISWYVEATVLPSCCVSDHGRLSRKSMYHHKHVIFPNWPLQYYYLKAPDAITPKHSGQAPSAFSYLKNPLHHFECFPIPFPTFVTITYFITYWCNSTIRPCPSEKKELRRVMSKKFFDSWALWEKMCFVRCWSLALHALW